MSKDFNILIDIVSEQYDEEQYEEALISVNKAIELEPSNVSGYMWRSNIFSKKGELKDELEDVLTMRDMYKKAGDTFMWMACVSRKQAIIDQIDETEQKE